MSEWVLAAPRARRIQELMYIGSITVKNPMGGKTGQIVVYSNNIQVLQQIVNEHNELQRIKKESK